LGNIDTRPGQPAAREICDGDITHCTRILDADPFPGVIQRHAVDKIRRGIRGAFHAFKEDDPARRGETERGELLGIAPIVELQEQVLQVDPVDGIRVFEFDVFITGAARRRPRPQDLIKDQGA